MYNKIEKMYHNAKKGNLEQEQINNLIKNDKVGFDDINNDYSSEIKEILVAIYKQPHINITKEQSLGLVKIILDNQDLNLIIENNKIKKIEYSSDAIEKMFENKKRNNNEKEFFNEIFSKNELDGLLKLRILIEDKELGKTLLDSDISLPKSLVEFIDNHYFYSTITKGKNFKIDEKDDVEHLSKELLKLENKLNELDNQKVFYQTIGWGRFIDDTYKLIFDKSNQNRNLFTFDFINQRLKKAIGVNEPKEKKVISFRRNKGI